MDVVDGIATSAGYFTKDGLRFLADLRTHNEKPWFEANKERFEAGLREPGLRLIADLEPILKKISKHFVADAKPNGGSMSRIYRDTRFSKDKSPYKTALFFHFGHARGSEDATPAFYFHIEPGGSTVGGGVWHPATPMLEKIRRAIVKSPSAWDKAKGKSGVGAACLDGRRDAQEGAAWLRSGGPPAAVLAGQGLCRKNQDRSTPARPRD